MKKRNWICWGLVLTVAIAVCVIAAAAIFGGESGAAGECKTYTVSSNIQNLEIEIYAAALRLETGAEFTVQSNHKYLEVSEKNGTLILEEADRLIHTTDYNDVFVTLTVPENFQFDRVEISTDAGTVDILGLQANDLDMELGAGTANITGLSVRKSAEIEGGAGDIALTGAEIADLKLEMGVGKVSFAGRLTGSCDLRFGVGEARLSLTGSSEDYRITFKKGLGDGRLNGQEMENGKSYGTGGSLIAVHGGIGACDITFAN